VLHFKIETSTRLVASTVTSALDISDILLITVARSTEDGYTPSDQVERIQDNLLSQLSALFLDVDITFDYKNV